MRFAIAFLADPSRYTAPKYIHISGAVVFGTRSACKNNLWGPSTTLRAEMIDGVPGCLPSSGSRAKTETETESESDSDSDSGFVTESQSQSRRQVNPKPKICCGRNISRTHCHREMVGKLGGPGSFSWRVSSTFRIEMSFWLALEFFIANCCQEWQDRGEDGLLPLLLLLPRAAIFLESPTQMSHQSCVQRCVRSKENIHFVFCAGSPNFAPTKKMESSLLAGCLRK